MGSDYAEGKMAVPKTHIPWIMMDSTEPSRALKASKYMDMIPKIESGKKFFYNEG